MSTEEIQKEIDEIIQGMDNISLSEMNEIKLMNRTDTKYVVSIELLADLLQKAKKDYWIQNNNGVRRANYQTTYFDTPDMQMYTAHHDGRKVREKIRLRTYVGSGLTFFEVKNKTTHGRTVKHRIKVKSINTLSADGANELLIKHAWFKLNEITPKIETDFRRITLVNIAKTERLTIDTDIKFYNIVNGNRISLPHLAIIELKRDGLTISPMASILNELKVKHAGFSKYCIGCAMTDSKLKQNRLKLKLQKIMEIGNISPDLNRSY